MKLAATKKEFVTRAVAQLQRLMLRRKFLIRESVILETTSDGTIIFNGDDSGTTWTLSGIKIFKMEGTYRYHDYHEAKYPSLTPEQTATRIAKFIRDSLNVLSRKSKPTKINFQHCLPAPKLPEVCLGTDIFLERMGKKLATLFPSSTIRHTPTSVIIQTCNLEIVPFLQRANCMIWECVGIRIILDQRVTAATFNFPTPIALPEYVVDRIIKLVQGYAVAVV